MPHDDLTRMLTVLSIAPFCNYQLVLVPALVILLVSFLAIGLRFSRANKAVGVLLIFAGPVEAIVGIFLWSTWSLFVGIITLMMGISIVSFFKAREDNYILSKQTGAVLFVLGVVMLFAAFFVPSALSLMMVFFAAVILVALGGVYAASGVNRLILKQDSKLPFRRWHTPRVRKALYLFFAVMVIVSSLAITVRATNLVHEEALVNYNTRLFGSEPTLTVKGVVTSVSYNHEVNMGYCYHIFPAYVTMQVTEVVWVTASYSNHTEIFTQRDLVVYYENQDAPNLMVGQEIEVNGCYCDWYEDSLYSQNLVVSTEINGSYLNPL